MVSRKTTSESLKIKTEKIKKDIEKIQHQKDQLITKEKKLLKQLKTIKADYIVALMSESGKSIEELERFAKSDHYSENGSDDHV